MQQGTNTLLQPAFYLSCKDAQRMQLEPVASSKSYNEQLANKYLIA